MRLASVSGSLASCRLRNTHTTHSLHCCEKNGATGHTSAGQYWTLRFSAKCATLLLFQLSSNEANAIRCLPTILQLQLSVPPLLYVPLSGPQVNLALHSPTRLPSGSRLHAHCTAWAAGQTLNTLVYNSVHFYTDLLRHALQQCLIQQYTLGIQPKAALKADRMQQVRESLSYSLQFF